MTKTFFAAATAVATLAVGLMFASAAMAQGTAVGTWVTEGGQSRIEIFDCDGLVRCTCECLRGLRQTRFGTQEPTPEATCRTATSLLTARQSASGLVSLSNCPSSSRSSAGDMYGSARVFAAMRPWRWTTSARN